MKMKAILKKRTQRHILNQGVEKDACASGEMEKLGEIAKGVEVSGSFLLRQFYNFILFCYCILIYLYHLIN